MIETVVAFVSGCDRSRRILINLLASMEAGHVGADLAHDLIAEVDISISAGTDPYPPHFRLRDVVFATPDKFQFQGPPPLVDPEVWVCIKHVDDLLWLMRTSSGLSEEQLSNALGFPVNASAHGLTSATLDRLADTLSHALPTLTFLMAGHWPSPDDQPRYGAGLRPAPIWFTTWNEFIRAFPRIDPLTASSKLAGSARDWLGLTHDEAPLLAIRTRLPVPPASLNAHRPTAFDGIDNPFYRHRVDQPDLVRNLGRTLNVDKLRVAAKRPTPPAEMAGGSEIVGRDVWYDAMAFDCIYLGKSSKLDFDVDSDIHHMLLAPYGHWDEVEAALLAAVARA